MANEPPQSPPGSTEAMRARPDHGEESYRGSGRLAGKGTVIAGGDSGIGRAVAIAFAREGADVLISYLNEHEDARSTADLVEAAGRRAILVPGDIGEPAHCKTIIDLAMEEFGRIVVLVNNADQVETVGKDTSLGRPGQPAELAPCTSCWPPTKPVTSRVPALR